MVNMRGKVCEFRNLVLRISETADEKSANNEGHLYFIKYDPLLCPTSQKYLEHASQVKLSCHMLFMLAFTARHFQNNFNAFDQGTVTAA